MSPDEAAAVRAAYTAAPPPPREPGYWEYLAQMLGWMVEGLLAQPPIDAHGTRAASLEWQLNVLGLVRAARPAGQPTTLPDMGDSIVGGNSVSTGDNSASTGPKAPGPPGPIAPPVGPRPRPRAA